jgi:guanylate kinase/dTMP kinase
MSSTLSRGLFVAFEGIEGSGKSTLLKSIKLELENRSIPVLATFEPGDTEIGATLRPLLLDNSVNSRAEALLFAADRAQHVATTIIPALEKGMVVLCDRYESSSIAYQGYWRGLGAESIRSLSQFASNSLTPDLTLWCQVEPSVARSRRSTHPDALDEAATAAGAVLAEAFAKEAALNPNTFLSFVNDGDMRETVIAIADRIEYELNLQQGKQPINSSESTSSTLATNLKSGRLVLIAGPSGSGKNTVLERLLLNRADRRWYSVSSTTRPPRSGEEDGQDYHFISDDEFDLMVRTDGFLEYANYAGFRYGTPRDAVKAHRDAGIDVFAVVELDGVRAIRALIPDALVLFLSPPSDEILETRLRSRATESELQIQMRLNAARAELRTGPSLADYTIVNHDLDSTVNLIENLLK